MRVLVTGAGGQLGRDLAEVFSGHDLVLATHQDLDVADRDAAVGAITTTRPDLVVHAAAWTAVDACEADPDRAFRVNSLGTRNVAEGARAVRAHLVYVSTDYVFDGDKATPYHEWDQPNPRSVYGRSKLGGERELDAHSTIVRTSWVCGEHGSNMLKTVLHLARSGETLSFVDDQRGCPTFTVDLAGKIRELATARLPGVFHVTNQGVVSWYGFARAVMDAAGLDPGRVRPIATADLDPPRPAPRPRNSALDNAALRHHGIAPLPRFEESLAPLVERLRG